MALVLAVVVGIFTLSFCAVLVVAGWFAWRIVRMREAGTLLVECRKPEHAEMRCYIARHVDDRADLKLEGDLLGVLQTWEDAYRRGIIKPRQQERA